MPFLLLSVMHALLADLQVDERHHQDDAKQDQRGGAGAALVAVAQAVVNEPHHGVEPSRVVDRAHALAEDTHDAGVFLEARDEAGDDDVSQHGRKQGHGDAPEHPSAGGGVHLGGLVILLVDAGQTAQQDQDLEGQGVPHDVHHQHEHVGRVGGAVVDPVDPGAAEELDHVVDDAGGDDQLVLRAEEAAHDVEHGGEHHADGDAIGHIGQEEDGLQSLLQGLDGVQGHGHQQGQQGGDGHREHAQQDGVFEALHKAAVVDHLFKVGEAELEAGAARGLQAAVILQESHAHGVDDGPHGEHQQQHNGGGQVQPGFPLLFAFYHLISPQN